MDDAVTKAEKYLKMTENIAKGDDLDRKKALDAKLKKAKQKKQVFDSANIRAAQGGAQAYLDLNMVVEFQAHRGD